MTSGSPHRTDTHEGGLPPSFYFGRRTFDGLLVRRADPAAGSRWIWSNQGTAPLRPADAASFDPSPRALRDGDSWRLDPGPFAFAPLYYAGRPDDVTSVSTDPAALAALIDAQIDPVALFQGLRFGFLIGTRTIFEGVHRVCPGEIVIGDERGARVSRRDTENSMPPRDAALIATLGKDIAGAYADGAAVELTGGVDSRLALALGLAAGGSPRLGFTIGGPQHADVRAAKAIADRFGIEHRSIPIAESWPEVGPDAAAFVERSGYYSNAVEYAWLPSIFRQLESFRTGQVTGGGGEAAYGFYDTPLDALLQLRVARRIWTELRLRKPGSSAHAYFRADSTRTLGRDAARDVTRALDSGPGAWRDRTARFYVEQRLRNWAAPVLCASAEWYRVAAPFMTPEYLRWALALAPERRAHRTAQLALMRSAQPDLAAMPFASAYTDRPAGRGSRLVGKIRRRFATRVEAPAHYRRVAEALAADPRITELVRSLPSRCESLSPERLDLALCLPGDHAVDLGFIITAAIAENARASLRRILHSPESKEA